MSEKLYDKDGKEYDMPKNLNRFVIKRNGIDHSLTTDKPIDFVIAEMTSQGYEIISVNGIDKSKSEQE